MTEIDGGLFLSGFLSATLLPGSSEALLLLRLSEGSDPMSLLLSATVGNLLGSVLTYGMGRGGSALLHSRRWLRISERDLARAERWFARWGTPTLLLAWLPIIGDPLCLLAGLLRVHLHWFVLLVGLGKAARYAALIWLFQ